MTDQELNATDCMFRNAIRDITHGAVFGATDLATGTLTRCATFSAAYGAVYVVTDPATWGVVIALNNIMKDPQ